MKITVSHRGTRGFPRSLQKKEASSSRKNEEELWRQWVASGKSPAALRPLLSSLEPLVHQTINKYRTADVSAEALKQEVENQLIRGLDTYSPSKGSLSTHLNWHMRNVGRFVERHQNLSRIPGNRIRYIGPYNRAKAQLKQELGREPTAAEISKRSRIPKKQVIKLEKELRPVQISGLNMDPTTGAQIDVVTLPTNSDVARLNIVYPDLTAQEKQLVDLITGKATGKPVTSTQDLARHLRVSPPRVSSLKNSVAKKMNRLSWVR